MTRNSSRNELRALQKERDRKESEAHDTRSDLSLKLIEKAERDFLAHFNLPEAKLDDFEDLPGWAGNALCKLSDIDREATDTAWEAYRAAAQAAWLKTFEEIFSKKVAGLVEVTQAKRDLAEDKIDRETYYKIKRRHDPDLDAFCREMEDLDRSEAKCDVVGGIPVVEVGHDENVVAFPGK
jgi:hypothetical protein